MRWQIPCNAADGFSVYPRSAADHVQIVFVSEVEEENIVGLPVDGFLNSIGLIGDECGEYAKMAHSSDDVIPVCFSQVEMSFFGEEKNCLEFPSL